MDLNQNPENEEFENIKARLITNFNYSSMKLSGDGPLTN